VQSLVYSLIALAGLGVWATAYFGLTFTPIEALVTALACGAIAVVLLERTLRQRSEARLEKAIGDLSRLLATDAQAGATLSQRVNAIYDENAGRRLDGLEADVSVLGTVVRQVAEAVADLEQHRQPGWSGAAEATPDPDTFPEPVIPLVALRGALAEGRLVCHFEPLMGLPMRRLHGYTLVPRLRLEDGDGFADPPEFMPRAGGEDVIREIEALAMAEAIVIARRLRSQDRPLVLNVPVSRHTLADAEASQRLLALLESNGAILETLALAVPQADYKALAPRTRASLGVLGKTGIGLAITAATSLRVDFAELQTLGVQTIGIDAHSFIDRPQALTDFHAADVAAYARRYGIELVGCGAIDEQQVIRLFEDGITLARGPTLGPVGPMQSPEAAPARVLRRAGA
jgi:cyclic-di-GMP phosphodiesterase TipF (flagellum assembly factor)